MRASYPRRLQRGGIACYLFLRGKSDSRASSLLARTTEVQVMRDVMIRWNSVVCAALLVTAVGCSKKTDDKAKADMEAAKAAEKAKVDQPPPEPPKPPEVKPKTPEELAALYNECWGHFSAKDWDKFKGCYAEGATSEMVNSGMPTLTGPSDIIEKGAKMGTTAFPDMKGELQLTLVNGKNVVGVALINGTNDGPLVGPGGEMPATKKKIGYLVGHVVQFDEKNQVAKEWLFDDQATMLGQLGLNPMPVRPVMDKGWAEKQTVIAKDDDVERANVEIYKKTVEAFNKHDAKAMSAMLDDKVVWSEVAMEKDMDKKEMSKGLAGMWKGFSDLKIEPANVWGAGDYVVSVAKMTGTNDGDVPMMKLKKTGKPIDISFLEIDKIKDGKVQTAWLFYNNLAFATQLGLVPPPGEKKAEGKADEKKAEGKADEKAEKKKAP
jgi:predicted ester cyclase